MRYEAGECWLTPDEWIPWVMANHPERIRDVDLANVVAELPSARDVQQILPLEVPEAA
jgi:hypothetical protein